MGENTEEIKKELADYRMTLMELQQEVQKYEIIIKNHEQELYKACDHEWDIDRALYSEHTEYICNKCGMYERLF